MNFLQKLYRRIRGMGSVRETPRTSWQEWASWRSTFFCKCGYLGEFTPDTYVIREQDHKEDCEHQFSTKGVCSCPVTDARYVKICPKCGMGNWKQAQT
jgi:hypothetical protein